MQSTLVNFTPGRRARSFGPFASRMKARPPHGRPAAGRPVAETLDLRGLLARASTGARLPLQAGPASPPLLPLPRSLEPVPPTHLVGEGACMRAAAGL